MAWVGNARLLCARKLAVEVWSFLYEVNGGSGQPGSVSVLMVTSREKKRTEASTETFRNRCCHIVCINMVQTVTLLPKYG